ncbi:uncharacterized protein MICPUCDRAFT_64527 [Micromonas pusilla CCMP1545]|jgi:hypothetical protein|uniref:Predicted protein n=2 Tax=Micromonas pusilla TaxID=38833 RepID=C1MKP5_MICPC|nr:uncharacterized protein MICPUCDRAFT_64527 [Micromonas pusilla CCMP1545]EEH59798.1 predicted protein [Micromonas pusilla CCMP1545]|mmetsp:Transcript_14060/g.50484  ORF Transcript_14060/g.50484 Transcript_14060/m.50484 type:complete len:534 (+) Transcript_14060:348-1949(+)|eukprot:XP_003056422.1 predicted protein [Micromonas pusilla CCMP1545]
MYSLLQQAQNSPRISALKIGLRVLGGSCAFRAFLLAIADLSSIACENFFHRSEVSVTAAKRRIIDLLAAITSNLHISMERLHLGDWRDVDPEWRELHMFSSLLFVSVESKMKYNISPFIAQAAGVLLPHVRRKIVSKSLDVAGLLGSNHDHDNLNENIDSFISDLRQGEIHSRGHEPFQKVFFYGTSCRLSSSCTADVKNRECLVSLHSSKRTWYIGEDKFGSLQSLLPPGSLSNTTNLLCGQVHHLCRNPSLLDFFRSYMPKCTENAGAPVLISGAVSHWPALCRWRNSDYLTAMAGLRTVPVELGMHYLHANWTQKLMSLSSYLDRYIRPLQPQDAVKSNTFDSIVVNGSQPKLRFPHVHQDKSLKYSYSAIRPGSCTGYLAQHPLFNQVPTLLNDLDLPDYCSLTHRWNTSEEGIKSINAWLGPAGTVSPLHKDPYHNLLSQVVGLKYIRMYAPERAQTLYLHPDYKLRNSSFVDMQSGAANLTVKFPSFVSTPFVDCVLEPGDMIYIPANWYHSVHSLSSSFSVSIWWH